MAYQRSYLPDEVLVEGTESVAPMTRASFNDWVMQLPEGLGDAIFAVERSAYERGRVDGLNAAVAASRDEPVLPLFRDEAVEGRVPAGAW